MAVGDTVDFRERWQVVHDLLKAQILTGEVAPSARLLEVEISRAVKMSRGPVREALRELENEGLVSRRPRLGTFVAPMDARDVDELYELRGAIEELAVRRAIATDPRGLQFSLQSSLAEMHAALDSEQLDQLPILDLDFHGAFYERAGNDRVLRVWLSLRNPLQRLVRVTGGQRSSDWRTTIDTHQAILDPVIRGDEKAAVKAVREHLELARARSRIHPSMTRPSDDSRTTTEGAGALGDRIDAPPDPRNARRA